MLRTANHSRFAAGRTARRHRRFPEPIARPRAAGGERPRSAVYRSANCPGSQLQGLLFIFSRRGALIQSALRPFGILLLPTTPARPGSVFIIDPRIVTIQSESGSWPVFSFSTTNEH